MSQNAHILAECFCIIAQQSNSTDAPLPKTWHFQAKHYFNNSWYDRKSAHLFYLCIINMGRAIFSFNPVPSSLCHVIDYHWDTKYPYLGGIELRQFGSQCCVRYTVVKWGHTEGIEREKTSSQKCTVIALDFWRD